MKIATWNTRGGKSPEATQAKSDELQSWDADIYVITEPALDLDIPGKQRKRSALRTSPGAAARWVSIHGPEVRTVPLMCPLSRMAHAAEVLVGEESVIVYGSVLPWSSAHKTEKDAALPGDTYASMYLRLLREQAQDVAALQAYHPTSTVIWAGDFNQTLDGMVLGSKANRVALETALEDVGMTAWNRAAPHAKDEACAIDLICGPAELDQRCSVECHRPTREGKPLFDHAGYVVTVALTAAINCRGNSLGSQQHWG